MNITSWTTNQPKYVMNFSSWTGSWPSLITASYTFHSYTASWNIRLKASRADVKVTTVSLSRLSTMAWFSMAEAFLCHHKQCYTLVSPLKVNELRKVLRIALLIHYLSPWGYTCVFKSSLFATFSTEDCHSRRMKTRKSRHIISDKMVAISYVLSSLRRMKSVGLSYGLDLRMKAVS